MAKGNRGGKIASAAKSGSTKMVEDDSDNIIVPITNDGKLKNRIEAMSNLPSDSNQKEKVEKERAKYVYNMMMYSTSQDSNGRKVSNNVVAELTRGTKADISKAVKDRARSRTFGNDDLYPEKLKDVVNLQNDLAQRQNRMLKLLNSKKMTDASFFMEPYYFESGIKVYMTPYFFDKDCRDYIDGKKTKIKFD